MSSLIDAARGVPIRVNVSNSRVMCAVPARLYLAGMRDLISISTRYPALSPLAVRHLLDLFGSASSLPEAELDDLNSTSWFGELPDPDSLGVNTGTATAFRALSVECRLLILRLSVARPQWMSSSHNHVEQEAVQAGFVSRRADGSLHIADELHRVAVLATADLDELSTCLSTADGAAADPTVRLDKAGLPLWAVNWSLQARARQLDPVTDVMSVASAANIAAFEGDLTLARRLIAHGASQGAGDRLLQLSAPARALIQVLQEDDMQAAHNTLQASLDSVQDDDIRNQCLTVLALRCMADPQESGWDEFIGRVSEDGIRAHPTLRRIAATMSAVNASDGARLSDAPRDGRRSWVEVVESIADVLDAFKTMRLAGHALSDGIGLSSKNVLAELIRTTFLSHVQIQSQFWNTAGTTASDALLLAQRVGSRLFALNAETMLAVVEAFRGDRDRASRRVEQVLTDPGIRRAHRLRAVAESVVILMEGSRGNYDVAVALLLTRRPDHLSLTVGPYGPIEVFDFVDYALKIGMVAEARRRLDDSTLVMNDFQSKRANFVLSASEAIIDVDHGLERIESLLLAAEGLPFVYEATRLRLVYAERLRSMRRITEARHQLLRVRMDFQNIGAVAWVDRVQRELRTTTREPIDDVTSALTEQEARVAELAAAGHSNKEIGRRLYLSPRTVAGHLYRLFPKLGVTTRAQLRDALNGVTAEEADIRNSGSVTPSGQDSRSTSQFASIAPAR